MLKKSQVFDLSALKVGFALIALLLPFMPKGEKAMRDWFGMDKWHLLSILFYHYIILQTVPAIISFFEERKRSQLGAEGYASERGPFLTLLVRWCEYKYLRWGEFLAQVVFVLAIVGGIGYVGVVKIYWGQPRSFAEVFTMEDVWAYYWARIVLDICSSVHASAMLEIKKVQAQGRARAQMGVEPVEVFASGVISPPSYIFLWFLVYYGILADMNLWLICDVIRTISSDVFNIHERTQLKIGVGRQNSVVKFGRGILGWVKKVDKWQPHLMLLICVVEFVDVLAVGWFGKLVFADQHEYAEMKALGGSLSWQRKQGLFAVFVCLPALFLTGKFQWKRLVLSEKSNKKQAAYSLPEWTKYTQTFHPLFGWFLLFHDSYIMSEGDDDDENNEGIVEEYDELTRLRDQATTFLVRTGDGREIVLKKFDENALNGDDMQRVRQEVKIIRHIRHVNIVRFIDYHERLEGSNRHGLFLEHVRSGYNAGGGTLADYWKRTPRPSRQALLGICYQVLKALEYLHQKGVSHRDLKPANILVAVSDAGRPLAKLADFGCASDQKKTCANEEEGTVVGTPLYRAPEMLLTSIPYSPDKTDIWAMGLVVFEAVFARPIFQQATEAATGRPLTNMRKNDGKANFERLIELSRFERSAEGEELLPSSFSDVERDFFESCFEGTADSRPSASDLLCSPLFDDVRGQLEGELY